MGLCTGGQIVIWEPHAIDTLCGSPELAPPPPQPGPKMITGRGGAGCQCALCAAVGGRLPLRWRGAWLVPFVPALA